MPTSSDLSPREQSALLEWLMAHTDAVRGDTMPPAQRQPSAACLLLWAGVHLLIAAALVRLLLRLLWRLLRP